MHIKKFTGATVKDAMRAVKAEFGEGALVLGTKRLAPGLYEVAAAVDHDIHASEKPAGPQGGVPSGQSVAGLPAERGAEPPFDGAFLKKEIRELKELCWTMIEQSRSQASETYMKLEEEFTANGIDRRLARKILMNAFRGASKDRAGDVGYLKSYMKGKVSERISVADPLSSKGVVAFVGPTGVGKTTTIAKLAAIQALKKKRRIALLTMDTYRIAAADQLKVYGRIIGVPVETARTAGDLASMIRENRDKDLILIDTAGRSPRVKGHMRELKEIAAISPDIRFNLVLSTQMRDDGLYDSIRGFSGVPVDSLTFTKLDECGVYGQILNTLILSKKPVAYLSNGQRVPEDIETATKERLLGFFMPN